MVFLKLLFANILHATIPFNISVSLKTLLSATHLSFVKEKLLELAHLDLGEGVVDNSQHQVHQEVQQDCCNNKSFCLTSLREF